MLYVLLFDITPVDFRLGMLCFSRHLMQELFASLNGRAQGNPKKSDRCRSRTCQILGAHLLPTFYLVSTELFAVFR